MLAKEDLAMQPEPPRNDSFPRLGVGTWAWGDRMMWGYDRGYGRADVEGAFRASVEAGLRFFDTAEVYGWGTSERILGDLCEQTAEPIRIATKFAPFRVSGRALLRALDGSLARLRASSVDLYQIHFPPFFTRMEPLMEALAEAVQRGKARAAGVSNFNVDQMRRAHEALERRGVRLASNQVEYSLLHRDPEGDGVLRVCRELGVTLIAYSPLAMGLLSGKYSPEARRHPRRLGRYLHLWEPQALVRVIGLLEDIGRAHGKTPSQVALNWLLRKPEVVVIPGAKNARQASENAGALGWEMAEQEADALDQATRAPAAARRAAPPA
jgi:aryl-alcohol dehydrogenase-like predicted oxidoreductase